LSPSFRSTLCSSTWIDTNSRIHTYVTNCMRLRSSNSGRHLWGSSVA
jgi:hypothetical protein